MANYFNISSDELLGIDISRNKEIIEEYIRQYFENSKDPQTQLTLMREANAKFPNNYVLMQYLMYSLVSNINIDLSNYEGFLSKAITVNDIDNRNIINEAVLIAERILSDCLEDSIRHSAIQVLCYYYPLLGNRDKAIQLANSIPPLYT